MAAEAPGSVMQCLGIRSRTRSRELYLQEQSLKVAALNGQRLGKGPGGHLALLGRQLGHDVGRPYVPELGIPAFDPLIGHVQCFCE